MKFLTGISLTSSVNFYLERMYLRRDSGANEIKLKKIVPQYRSLPELLGPLLSGDWENFLGASEWQPFSLRTTVQVNVFSVPSFNFSFVLSRAISGNLPFSSLQCGEIAFRSCLKAGRIK